MEQIKLFVRSVQSNSLLELQEEANVWLTENTDKDIVGISIISYTSAPDIGPDLAGPGWIIMIHWGGPADAPPITF